MFGRKHNPAKEARKFTEGLVAKWAKGDVAGAMTMLSHGNHVDDTRRRAAAGLIWATSAAPKTIEILRFQVDGEDDLYPELRAALPSIESPEGQWANAPTGVPLEMLIMHLSGTIARDHDGLQVLWDLSDEKYLWPEMPHEP